MWTIAQRCPINEKRQQRGSLAVFLPVSYTCRVLQTSVNTVDAMGTLYQLRMSLFQVPHLHAARLNVGGPHVASDAMHWARHT